MRNLKPFRLISEKVEDIYSNTFPERPKDYPEIVGRAKALILSLETGDEHIYNSDKILLHYIKKF